MTEVVFDCDTCGEQGIVKAGLGGQIAVEPCSCVREG